MNLDGREWREFYIGGKDGVFEISSSSSGIDKNKLLLAESKTHTPYITRTDEANGISLFISEEQKEKYDLDEGNVITIGLDTQTVFYQAHKFYTGQNIQVLRHRNLNILTAEFLIPLIKVQMQKFNWGGNGATLGRLFKTKLMLPVNKQKSIDWKFMEEYSKSTFEKKKGTYLNYIEKVLSELEYKKIVPLKDKSWKEFVIGEMFNIKIGKNVDGNKIDKLSGAISYVTRKETNNGLDGFINYNCSYMYTDIPVITIGNETAKPFVQTSPFFTGTKVNIMKAKQQTKTETLFFIAQCLEQQKNKYSYSITINSTRLKKQKILLPTNDKKEPDYEYMQQYIQNIQYKKIKQYLNSLESNCIEKAISINTEE